MEGYLKKHTTQAAYITWTTSNDFVIPNVSLIDADGGLLYNPIYSQSQNDPVTPSHNYANDYFTTIPLVDATFTFTVEEGELSYSTDNGTTWSESTSGEIVVSNVMAGNKVLWKGALEYADYGNKISCDESFNVEGNVMSLLYGDNFVNQTVIPQNASLRYLFEYSSLVNAQNLILPATTLVNSCYDSMFLNCTTLTTAPELPATTLANGCYQNMFGGCTSLTTAPELPATTLANSCYIGMLSGCTSLTTAPELPATTLAADCYSSMFSYCTSLTTAPELPVTTLAYGCYANMFEDCTSLTTAPELPATILATNCYYDMFNGCTSLTTAPELPATTLTNYCYYQMFSGCTSLNYIKCLATDISAIECTSYWVYNVAASGTFVKDTSMSSWTTGTSGIPSGWTVQDAA